MTAPRDSLRAPRADGKKPAVDPRTEAAATEPAQPGPESRVLRLAGTALVLLTAAVILVAWMGRFVVTPKALPPGQDISWYVWRSELLTAHPPEVLVGWEGPLGVFRGAHRVASPLLGSLLRSVADVDRYTVSVFLVSGRAVLVALMLGAVAFHLRRDRLVFATVALFAGGLLFFNPYIGYVDNFMAMLLLGACIPLLDGARRSARHRTMVGLLVFLSFFFHPPTATVFAAVLVAAVGLRAALVRPFREALRPEAPLLAAVVVGASAAVLAWRIGIWGPGAWFGESAHPPPLDPAVFFATVREWVRMLGPLRMVPLMVLGILVVALPWKRFVGRPSRRAAVLWLLPLVGVLGYFLGLSYPFQRFLNGTLAPLLLAGLGTWALGVAPVRLARRRRGFLPAAVIGVGLAALVLVSVWREATSIYQGRRPWLQAGLQGALEATRTYLDGHGDTPVVFVVSPNPRAEDDGIWGRTFKGNTSRVRAGVPGRLQPDTFVFMGGVSDLLAGHPSETGNPLLDRVSRASYEDMERGLAGRAPLVFLVRQLNKHLDNARFLEPPNSLVLDVDVSVLVASHLASPDVALFPAARSAGEAVRRSADVRPDRLARPAHLGRALIGLALLLVVPGLMAARWLGIRDLPALLGMVPPLSLALTLASGLLVVAVLRRPVGAGVGLLAVLLAVGAAGAMLLLGGRPRPVPSPGDQGPGDHRGQGQGGAEEPVSDPGVVVGEQDGMPARRNRDRLE